MLARAVFDQWIQLADQSADETVDASLSQAGFRTRETIRSYMRLVIVDELIRRAGREDWHPATSETGLDNDSLYRTYSSHVATPESQTPTSRREAMARTEGRGDVARRRWSGLRRINPADYDALFLLAATRGLAPLDRSTQPLRASDFVPALWAAVSDQWSVVDIRTGQFRGHACVYSLDPLHGICYMGLRLVDDLHDAAWLLESIELTVSVVFNRFDCRKVYIESLNGPVGPVRLFEGLIHLEAHRPAYTYLDGSYRDLYTYALYREEWVVEPTEKLRATIRRQLDCAAEAR